MKNEKQKAILIASQIIQSFEDCKLTAYKCPAGIWTIGWGETQGIKKGMKWTQKQADTAFEKRIVEFSEGVLSACPVLATMPFRLAACISLAYNIGISNFSGSTVARYIRYGEYRAAADAFLMWVYAGGKKLSGLEKRRRAERELYLTKS